MAESETKIFVTVGVQPSNTENLVAVISQGHPGMGSDEVTVLTLKSFPKTTPKADIQNWAQRMMLERPWETRQ